MLMAEAVISRGASHLWDSSSGGHLITETLEWPGHHSKILPQKRKTRKCAVFQTLNCHMRPCRSRLQRTRPSATPDNLLLMLHAMRMQPACGPHSDLEVVCRPGSGGAHL